MSEKERRRQKKAAPQEETTDLPALTRRVLLAGVGAAALAHDEMKAFLDRLVERGELAREQARDMLKEVAAKREGRLRKMGKKARERVDRALQAFDVPRRADLEALQQRLDQLTQRLEVLLKPEEPRD